MTEQTLNVSSLLPYLLPVVLVLVTVTAVLVGRYLSHRESEKARREEYEIEVDLVKNLVPRDNLHICAWSLVPQLGETRDLMLKAASQASTETMDDSAALETLRQVGEHLLEQVTAEFGLQPDNVRNIEGRENGECVVTAHISRLLNDIRLSLREGPAKQALLSSDEAYYQVFRLFTMLLDLMKWYYVECREPPWNSIYSEKVPGGICDERGLPPLPKRDWSEAPSAGLFVGREDELNELERYIRVDEYRVVLLVGMMGAGKSTLATKAASPHREGKHFFNEGGVGKSDMTVVLARGIGSEFTHSFWRTVQNLPKPEDIFASLVDFLSAHKESLVDGSLDDQLKQIIKWFKQVKALVILDNFESVLKDDASGEYEPGYEAFGKLISAAGEQHQDHQSCLLLTSRVTPKEVADLERKNKPVRKLVIKGLLREQGRELVTNLDASVQGDETQWGDLIEYYGGNPLMLGIAARCIAEDFGGSIGKFLNSSPHAKLFDVREHLDWHFDRLSRAEEEILSWMAIEREPVTMQTLQDDVLPSSQTAREVVDNFRRLRRRLFVNQSDGGSAQNSLYTLQPMLLEYVTERLVDGMSRDLENRLNLEFLTPSGEPS